MAEVLMIRPLDEKTLSVLEQVKKKHQITTNSKATLKIFEEYKRLLEKVEIQDKKITKLEQQLNDQDEVLRSVKKTFNLISKLK